MISRLAATFKTVLLGFMKTSVFKPGRAPVAGFITLDRLRDCKKSCGLGQIVDHAAKVFPRRLWPTEFFAALHSHGGLFCSFAAWRNTRNRRALFTRCSARLRNLAGRDEATASSDMARRPFTAMRSTTKATSRYGIWRHHKDSPHRQQRGSARGAPRSSTPRHSRPVRRSRFPCSGRSCRGRSGAWFRRSCRAA